MIKAIFNAYQEFWFKAKEQIFGALD